MSGESPPPSSSSSSIAEHNDNKHNRCDDVLPEATASPTPNSPPPHPNDTPPNAGAPSKPLPPSRPPAVFISDSPTTTRYFEPDPRTNNASPGVATSPIPTAATAITTTATIAITASSTPATTTSIETSPRSRSPISDVHDGSVIDPAASTSASTSRGVVTPQSNLSHIEAASNEVEDPLQSSSPPAVVVDERGVGATDSSCSGTIAPSSVDSTHKHSNSDVEAAHTGQKVLRVEPSLERGNSERITCDINGDNITSSGHKYNIVSDINKDNITSSGNKDNIISDIKKDNIISDIKKDNIISDINKDNITSSGNKDNIISDIKKDNIISDIKKDNIISDINKDNITSDIPKNNIISDIKKDNITSSGNKDNIISDINKENITSVIPNDNIISDIKKDNITSDIPNNNIIIDIKEDNITNDIMEDNSTIIKNEIVDDVMKVKIKEVKTDNNTVINNDNNKDTNKENVEDITKVSIAESKNENIVIMKTNHDSKTPAKPNSAIGATSSALKCKRVDQTTDATGKSSSEIDASTALKADHHPSAKVTDQSTSVTKHQPTTVTAKPSSSSSSSKHKSSNHHSTGSGGSSRHSTSTSKHRHSTSTSRGQQQQHRHSSSKRGHTDSRGGHTDSRGGHAGTSASSTSSHKLSHSTSSRKQSPSKDTKTTSSTVKAPSHKFSSSSSSSHHHHHHHRSHHSKPSDGEDVVVKKRLSVEEAVKQIKPLAVRMDNKSTSVGAAAPAKVESKQVAPSKVESKQVAPSKVETKQVAPSKVEPKPVDPVKVEPKPVDQVKVESKAVDPVKVEPKPVDQVKVEPKPVAPLKVEPKPVAPVKVEPKPVAPVKIEPKPVAPVKVEPKPVDQVKVEPKPVAPLKVEPKPVAPSKVEPKPADPVTPKKPMESIEPHKNDTPRKKLLDTHCSDLITNCEKFLFPKRKLDTYGSRPRVIRNYRLKEKSKKLEARMNALLYSERDPNGGGLSLHAYNSEIQKALTKDEIDEFAEHYFKEAFREVDGKSVYTIAIVHEKVLHLPDPIEYLAFNYPELTVKTNALGRLEIDTMTALEYRNSVHRTFKTLSHQAGGLNHISMVGVRQEETGTLMSDFLDRIEQCPFLKRVMPWGANSLYRNMDRTQSNDGPILWSRPGEQMLTTGSSNDTKSPYKRQRCINELRNLQYLPRGNQAPREQLIEDRTKAHADHVGYGPDRMTTAAVGLLKAVHCGHSYHDDCITKDCILWASKDFNDVARIMKLDLHEPPMSQCITWADSAKLLQMRREGIKYSHVQLRDNDIYFIPRNVIHQFKSVTAVTSIAWHVRLKIYYKDTDTATAAKSEE